MELKIRGVEHELAMNTQPQLPARSVLHLVGMAIEELKKMKLVSGIKVEEPRLDYMAFNGFRVYDDMSHLELSSPSYNTPMEAVVYDKVAELFGYYAVKGLGSYFKGINAYKNNISNQREGSGWRSNAYSTHASILMDFNVANLDIWDRVEKALASFMVARIPLTGGGDYVACNLDGYLPRPGKYIRGESLRYVISPRAAFIKRLSSNDTVDARGLLNQRNDPHANPAKYWRLHDINWEGIRSPFQVYLRDSLEVLVMTAYERGYLKDPPQLADPVSSIRTMTIDVEKCNWKLELEDGSKVDAVDDVMAYYLGKVEEMLGEEDVTEADINAFKLVKATMETIGSRKLEFFIDGLDWVTKKTLIDEYADGDIETGVALCNQFTLLDDTVLEYIGEKPDPENVQTTYSLSDALEFARDAIPWEDWDGFTDLIKNGLVNGPEGSREYIRCLVLREFPGLLKSIEWESINFQNFRIKLDEPFMYSKKMCGDVLEKATGTFSEFSKALNSLDLEKAQLLYAPQDDVYRLDTEED
ncbi:proteasome accessory factor PafA2 family protein [Candidatus Bathyarchaeota archaeon]|nr:proteasome accessory factor PafA2 family protein [Candidatus Bathyarchaeota archaeon]